MGEARTAPLDGTCVEPVRGRIRERLRRYAPPVPGAMPYSFVRRHMTLETTPPVAAGVAEREWTMAARPSKARRPLHPPSKEA